MPQFISTLQFWYDRGVRFFKFDFAHLEAAPPEIAKRLLRTEIRDRNSAALRQALMDFRRRNPEVLLAGFNGFGGEVEGTYAPVRQTVDPRWLLAFDSLYCGDPRPSRWMNVYYGNLELIDDAKAQWFAKVQRIYFELQSFGRTYPFGGLPGQGVPYGFASVGESGSLYTVVNLSQSIRTVKLPRVHRLQTALDNGRIQFRDAGFLPKLACANDFRARIIGAAAQGRASLRDAKMKCL